MNEIMEMVNENKIVIVFDEQMSPDVALIVKFDYQKVWLSDRQAVTGTDQQTDTGQNYSGKFKRHKKGYNN